MRGTLASSGATALLLVACVSDNNAPPGPGGVDASVGLDASVHLDAAGDSAPCATCDAPGDALDAGPPGEAGDSSIGSFDAASCVDSGAGRCLIVLASNQGNAQGTSIDSTHVYWLEEGIPGGVHSAPINGGPIATLATNQLQSFGTAVNATTIYWTNQGLMQVLAAPLAGLPDGGAPSVIARVQAPSAIAVDANGVYFTSPTLGLVLRAPLGGAVDGGMGDVIAQGQSYPWMIAIDATSLYWTNQGTGGAVMRAPLAGGATPTTLVPNQTGAGGIAIDANSVYWTNATTAMVLKAPLAGLADGGTPTVIAQSQAGVDSVAVDGAFAYWTTNQNGTGIVARAPIAGGGPVETLATGQTIAGSLVIDANNVYWSDFAFGKVLQMPKAP